MRDAIFQRAVVYAVVVDGVGIFLVLLPFVPMNIPTKLNYLLFFFGVVFDIVANILLISMCLATKCWYR